MHYVGTQKRSKSQAISKIMQQRASKKQLLSSCHLALKSSPANVNELSGHFRSLLVQVETGQMFVVETGQMSAVETGRCLLLRQDRKGVRGQLRDRSRRVLHCSLCGPAVPRGGMGGSLARDPEPLGEENRRRDSAT